jgi:hypothetical protein
MNFRMRKSRRRWCGFDLRASASRNLPIACACVAALAAANASSGDWHKVAGLGALLLVLIAFQTLAQRPERWSRWMAWLPPELKKEHP